MATRLTTEQVRDAGYVMVAVGSVAYAEARLALGRIYTSAQQHGLTMADLVTASGRSEEFITELLEELD